MYDAKNEPHEFVADGRDEAIEKACKFFGVGRDALDISEPRSGEVYGLGGRAVIVAALKDRRPAPSPPSGRGRDRDRDRGGRGDRPPDRDRDRDRERGGRPRRGREGSERRERGASAERGGRGGRASEPVASSEPSVGTAEGEVGPIGEYLLGILERMDVGPFAIGASEDGQNLVFEVRGAAAQHLTSGEGRPVDALQLLCNQAAMRLETPRRVVVDMEGDTDERESFLAELAERVARRARDTGRAIRLDPMNPRDRRTIHLALRDEKQVATMSTGEGRYRQVVVVPEGAPEFEEAQREAAAAAAQAED